MPNKTAYKARKISKKVEAFNFTTWNNKELVIPYSNSNTTTVQSEETSTYKFFMTEKQAWDWIVSQTKTDIRKRNEANERDQAFIDQLNKPDNLELTL